MSDDSTGLPTAIATQLPHVKQQRCVVHKIRGLEQTFCYRDLTMTDLITLETCTHEPACRLRRQQLSTDAHAIFEAPSRAEAEVRLAQFRTTWGILVPEAVGLLTEDVNACLMFHQYDQSLHKLTCSTNLLERFFREFRTKADEIGAFPGSIIRFSWQTFVLEEWRIVVRPTNLPRSHRENLMTLPVSQ